MLWVVRVNAIAWFCLVSFLWIKEVLFHNGFVSCLSQLQRAGWCICLYPLEVLPFLSFLLSYSCSGLLESRHRLHKPMQADPHTWWSRGTGCCWQRGIHTVHLRKHFHHPPTLYPPASSLVSELWLLTAFSYLDQYICIINYLLILSYKTSFTHP